MGLTICKRILNNVKPLDAIYEKFVDKFFTSLTVLGLKSKGSVSSTTKEKLFLYCRKLLAFVVAVII